MRLSFQTGECQQNGLLLRVSRLELTCLDQVNSVPSHVDGIGQLLACDAGDFSTLPYGGTEVRRHFQPLFSGQPSRTAKATGVDSASRQ
jgi:hypothetical protein